ncbi:MAG: type IVB secretion system protein DotG/IcmE [Gammaproteobacteria bacterium]
MATTNQKKENIKALFTNTRTRIIIAFTLILVLATIVIGFVKFFSASNPLNEKSGVQRGAGGIRSIPGSLNQTAQYAALQETQNVEQAKEAAAKGKSAIPTIIRSQAFSEGVEPIGAQGGEGSVGFSTLAREGEEGPQSTVWYQNLKDQQCSPDSIKKAMDAGAVISDLKKVCTCEKLKRKGFTLPELKPICPCPELRALGFSPKQFKDAGYCAAEMKVCGFTACEEHAAGFSVDEMKNAGYSDGELQGSGFSPRDIARAGGLPDGVSLKDVHDAGCDVEKLRRLRSQGVSAAAIVGASGCSAEALKAAGYSALELKAAGFSAADLKAAGFTPEELRQAGFSARNLMDAGFSAADLAAAGFSPADISAAETLLPQGFSATDIKNAGCSPEAINKQRQAGVSAYMIKKLAGCSASALKAGGFSVQDLGRAGFKPEELTEQALAGAGVIDRSGIADDEIKKAGCDVTQLKTLLGKGVSAERIHRLNGCTADALRKAGFSLHALANAGFSQAELMAAGFTPKDLADEALASGKIVDTSGLSDDAVKKAGCDVNQLKTLLGKGVTAERIHKLNGCSADALKKAGYSLKALAAAGFTPAQLLNAGFTPQDLKAGGLALSPAGLLDAIRTSGCNVEALKAARLSGVSAKTIKATSGCDAAAMKAAGYSASDLREAGFSAAQLKGAGFSAADLKAAGFSAKDLHAAGFSAAELKALGYSAAALKDAGFSVNELKAAGFSAADLKTAGFTAKEIKDAGFPAGDLKAAGFSAGDLKAAGVNVAELKAAGYSSQELQAAGFSPRESALAGLAEISPRAGATMPSFPGAAGVGVSSRAAQLQAANAQKLEKILAQQKIQMADQKYQQKVQQRTSAMIAAANPMLQIWKAAPVQTYTSGSAASGKAGETESGFAERAAAGQGAGSNAGGESKIVIKTGDIMFAVIETSVNSDEPGPILATIVSGSLKGAKLIGSFNLPSSAEKMVISFNALSVPGAPKTMSISAFAIDPNTARTALSSETNHHYLSRYGALFASTFLEGFGNAFQSADTTITIGGTGDTQQTTVQNGIGRSALENAVIGLATVGKAWGQVAQQNMNQKPTVEVFSGTGIGVLFTQDVNIK